MTATDKARELARKWEARSAIKLFTAHADQKAGRNLEAAQNASTVIAIEKCLADLRAAYNLPVE